MLPQNMLAKTTTPEFHIIPIWLCYNGTLCFPNLGYGAPKRITDIGEKPYLHDA